MERHNKVPTKYASKPFMFRGLIVCGKCGGVVGGQLKKGKYAYYSCSGFKDCKRVYVPEVELLKQVYGVLDGFNLSDEMIQDITEGLKQIGENENKFYKKNVTAEMAKDKTISIEQIAEREGYNATEVYHSISKPDMSVFNTEETNLKR